MQMGVQGDRNRAKRSMSWEERMKQKTVALLFWSMACLVGLGVVGAVSPVHAQADKPNILVIWDWWIDPPRGAWLIPEQHEHF